MTTIGHAPPRLAMPRHALVLPLAVALLGVLAFARVVTFDFAYDDAWTLVENAWLSRSWAGLAAMLANGEAVQRQVPDATRPMMVLGHWLERRAYGLTPWGYHLDSLLLYGLVCGLATRLALVLGRRRDVALFAGCFFALAPLHAEPVAAVNYREDLLASVGMLGALLVLCTATRDGARRDPGRRALAAGALLAFALLSKESALAFVPLLGAVVLLVPWARATVKASRRSLYALGGVLLLWLLWRVPLSREGQDLPLAPARPLGELLLRTARFEVQAVRHALLPWSYAPDHWRQPDASASWLVPFISIVLGVLVLGKLKSTRLPALGVALALTAPLACSPLLRPVNEYADRYFFLGALGGGIFWGWAAARALESLRPGASTKWLPLLCVPLLVPTWHATALWRDERSLWTAAVERTPGSARAWAALSRVHRLAGERELADAASLRALAADPDYAPARLTEVYNDLAFGRVEDARTHLAAMEQQGLGGDGGGVTKAKRCAALDRSLAARCIAR